MTFPACNSAAWQLQCPHNHLRHYNLRKALCYHPKKCVMTCDHYSNNKYHHIVCCIHVYWTKWIKILSGRNCTNPISCNIIGYYFCNGYYQIETILHAAIQKKSMIDDSVYYSWRKCLIDVNITVFIIVVVRL